MGKKYLCLNVMPPQKKVLKLITVKGEIFKDSMCLHRNIFLTFKNKTRQVSSKIQILNYITTFPNEWPRVL